MMFWKKKPKQYSFIYCPGCRSELIGSDSWLYTDPNNPAMECYKCKNCLSWSKWDFDTYGPAMVCVEWVQVV